MPGYENRPKRGPTKAADPCHKAPSCASARAAPGVIKMRQKSARHAGLCFNRLSCGPIRFPVSSPGAASASTGDHDLEFDDFAGVTPLSCHLPILAAADRMLAPRNRRLHQWRAKHDIFGQWRGQQVMVARGGKAMPDIPRPLRQSSQCMHFAHRVFAPVIRTGSR